MQCALVQHSGELEPSLSYLSFCSPPLPRRSCWVATDRTWWREVITGLWRCGRRATSNSFTSTQAVTQASEPWTSHMTRGKTDRRWRASQIQGCAFLRDYWNWVTSNDQWWGSHFSQTSEWCPRPREIHSDWCTAALKKVSYVYSLTYRCVCSALRTLITGMASGSIVAFNIDFNRWHYEHQNRYWGGQHEEEEDGERREEQGGEEVMHSAVYLQPAGETTGTEGKEKQVPDLRLYSLVKFTWFEDAAALVEATSSVHTCAYTRV